MAADPPTDEIWKWRFESIAESQRRSRWSVLVSVIVSGAILAAEWNSYFSWDRQWAWSSEPSLWGRSRLLEEQIKAWIESNTVDIALLGIRVSVSDAAVLGSVALLIASYYMCMSLRRENEEVAALLTDAASRDDATRQHVFVRIRSTTLFTVSEKNDAPIRTLDGRRSGDMRIPFASPVLSLLTYLPALTIFAVVASDIYFATLYRSPWHQNAQSAWYLLSPMFRFQLVAMDAFGVLAGVLSAVYCRFAAHYRDATKNVIAEFASLQERPRGGAA